MRIFSTRYNFINELDVSYLHVFTYSERANTKAIEIEGVVPVHTRNERNAMFRSLSEKKRRYFYNQFLGEERKVLFEQERKGAIMHGFTDNYIKVAVPFDASMVNQLVPVQLQDFDEAGNIKCGLLSSVY